MPDAERRTQSSITRATILSLVGLGIVLRVIGSLDQLWLDEIWSLKTVLEASSPLDLVTRPHYDNTHVLNSLFLWLVKDAWWTPIYRALSLVSGVGLLLLAAAWPRRSRILPLSLLAFSYPLVVYGSEARGYAPAMLAGMAALLLCDRIDERGPDRPRMVLLWSAVLTGLLAHLSFAFVLLALGVLTIARAWATGLAAITSALATRFGVPLALAAVVYVPYLITTWVGGGPREDLGGVLRDWLTLSCGAPREGAVAWLGATATLALLAGEIVAEFRERDARWAFWATLLLAPPLALLLVQPAVLVVRYLIVTVPLLVLALARALERAASRGAVSRALAGAALALMLVGNGLHVRRFLSTGRGHYREAVAFIRAGTHAPVATVTSDHDFRNPMVLWFHARSAPGRTPLVYSSLSGPPGTGAEWLITHSLARRPAVPARLAVGAVCYDLAYVAPYFGELSGFHWHVYRRLAAAPRGGCTQAGGG